MGIAIDHALVIGPVGRYGRNAVPIDPIQAAIVTGQWTAPKAGEPLTRELFTQLLEEEHAKLLRADSNDVHDDSKATTLPIARAIVEAYVLEPLKAPWYIDLLNLNLNVTDLSVAEERIRRFLDAFGRDGTRITRNLDFDREN